MKRILGLIAGVVLAAAFAVGSQAGTSSSRSGALHVTKECSAYFGQPGEFCTITSSSLKAIDVHSKVIYLQAATATGVDSDLVVDTGPGNVAYGHVTLSFTTRSGVVTLAGGTGQFRGFHARVAVTFDERKNLWAWDGTYSFIPPGTTR